MSTMTKLDRLYLYTVVLLVLVIGAGGALLIHQRYFQEQPLEIVPGTPTARSETVVYITGAVNDPGVYSLKAEARVADALLAAGGATAEADLVHINLAVMVRDGDQIHVPARGEVSQRINLNTADARLLETLPGIGPVLAQRIVDYRQQNGYFRRPEDILKVEGIGKATYEKIKGLIAVN